MASTTDAHQPFVPGLPHPLHQVGHRSDALAPRHGTQPRLREETALARQHQAGSGAHQGAEEI